MYESRLLVAGEHNLDLFVIDSAGRCFPNLRVRCHAQLKRRRIACCRVDRRAALHPRALSAFSREFASRRLVVKLTGKYVLPGLEAALRAVPAGATAVVQTLKFPWHDDWQSTELWGMTPALLRECMVGMEADELMEQRANRCVTDVVAAAGVGGGCSWRAGACPTARDLTRTLAPLRWAIWDAPCNHSSSAPRSTPPTASAARRAGRAACGGAPGGAVHALPPSVRLPVYRLPPLAVPEVARRPRRRPSSRSCRSRAPPPSRTRRRRSATSRTRSTSSPARRGERRRRASRRARGTLRTTITISFGAAAVARIRSDLPFTPLHSQCSSTARQRAARARRRAQMPKAKAKRTLADDLTAEDIREAFARAGSERKLKPNAALVQQGKACSSVFLVLEGALRAGSDRPIGVGAFVGEVSFLLGGAPTLGVTATAASVVAEVKHDALQRICVEDPALAGAIFKALAATLAERVHDESARRARVPRARLRAGLRCRRRRWSARAPSCATTSGCRRRRARCSRTRPASPRSSASRLRRTARRRPPSSSRRTCASSSSPSASRPASPSSSPMCWPSSRGTGRTRRCARSRSKRRARARSPRWPAAARRTPRSSCRRATAR